MLRDVFYYGNKPNVHPRERHAKNLKDARKQATTEHFWIINEFCDYKNFDWDFDFDFLPDEDVWAQDHNNVWPSQHQKDSGTWLCSKKDSEIIIYRNDVDTVHRKNIKSNNWKIIQKIDETKFNFSWHPDPTEPPYIYVFPTIWNQVGGPQFVVEGATQKKYITSQIATTISTRDNWNIPSDIDVTEFDFTWVPHPEDPPYIYQFGTQWQKDGGPQYIVQGAKEIKYVSIQKAKALPTTKNWTVPTNIDVTGFDFSWHPDQISLPYIYIFATQWALTGGPIYTVEGATEKKYVEYPTAVALPDKTNWEIPNNIDVDNFDFSWHPFAEDDPCIYQIGTQHQKTGGPRYVVPSTDEMSPVKYIDRRIIKSKALSDNSKFKILHPIIEEEFDWSWHPDTTEEPYIYVFGNQHYTAEKMPTVEYHVEGATQYKFINDVKATLAPTKTNWVVNLPMAESVWDFTWVPDPGEPPYIYVFGNQWHDAEIESTIEYHMPGATEKKYINDVKATVLPDMSRWKLNYLIDKKKFDFSWRPDPGSPPYTYVFGSNLYPAEEMNAVEYNVEGASEYKYISNITATLAQDKSKWIIPANVDVTEFDFSWHPNPKDPAYIYYAGTQWQKSGGPKYIVEGANDIKYLEGKKVKALPSIDNWVLPPNIDVTDFDFSWHPDDTEPSYIYQFGTQWALTGGPRYVMPEATEIKYMDNPVAKALSDTTNWTVPDNIDSSSFDFSWHPYVEDQPYVYMFGTQHQKTGGPVYTTPGADEMSPVKYIDRRILKSKATSVKERFTILNNHNVVDFDYSWHHDETEEPYIYVFGNQYYSAEKMPTVEYRVEGATQYKYINTVKATLGPNKANWHTIIPIDETKWDYTWVPDPGEPAYIYVWGNQWNSAEVESTVEYRVPGGTEKKYMNDRVATVLPDRTNWNILEPIHEDKFDFSWRPNPYEDPYVYTFGNNLYPAEEMPTVEYKVPTAKQRKYLNDFVAQLAPDRRNWEIPDDIDISNFDFSWKPHPMAPSFIYEFGTQWQKTGGPRYVVPGATEVNYIPGSKAIYRPKSRHKYWEITETLDISDFDFSWHPDTTEKPYIYQFGTQWALTGGPRYIVPGAKEIKYIDNPVAKMRPSKTNWEIPKDIDINSFDFSWHPYIEDQPYIYQFGTQWQKTGGPRYISPGADEMSPVKYIDRRILKATKLPNKKNYEVINNLVIEDFDYSWHPDETDGEYIYTFGNTQYPAEVMPTLIYKTTGATKVKYINQPKAKLGSNKTNWQVNDNLDVTLFDFSWLPDPNDPPYIYVFGNQWNRAEKESTVEYRVPGATEYKYVHDIIATTLPIKDNWKINIPVDKSFDFSWRPDPNDPPYIYVFGNQWNKAEKESTVEYITPGATDKKYIQDIIANVAENLVYWKISTDIDVSDFDFSWRPDSGAPPYIYQFGTLENDNDGPTYHTPENTGEIVRLRRVYKKHSTGKTSVGKYFITTTLQDLAEQHPNELFWALRENIDYTNFDFDWSPNIEQARYVHVFGSPESEATQTYFVSGPMWEEGYRDFNFVEQDKVASEEYLAELFVQPDIFLVDKGNIETQERFEQLKARFTNVSKTRFLNSWVDTINRCINRSNTEVCWILNSELDYNNFDFKYYPNPWQMKMVHVFGTQWSHWGTTFMVNRDTFAEDTKYVKIIEHLNNLNFVKERRAIATNNLYDIVVINHGNKDCERVVASLEARSCGKKVSTIDYDESYLKTIKKIVANVSAKKEHFVWIASSVCNYGEFDFTYICDPFAKDSLHVFPSDRQKFGDTFLLDINKAKEFIETMELLQQYPKVNYNQATRAKRLSAPVIKTGQDTHVEAINADFDFPYAVLQTEEITTVDNEPMNLWTPDSKSILITSTGGTRIIVPKEAKSYVKDQLYDYPYIKTASKLVASKPLDIVFLSNGEKCADENYEHLLAVTKGLKNRIVRVDGVNGRVDAYHAAVKASETNWTFTVFAKLKVDNKFDWGWQPDRLQMPKHYIFHAKNPINGLEYGHQGMIAYNKALTLNNFGDGLDFTLDDPHETVEILSGIATFNTDAYSTWRTSFREVIKLKSDYTDISQERLKAWLTKAKGKFAKDCLQGANDAVEYYDSVSGDIDQLKFSYEWNWLLEYYNRKYK